MAQALLPATDSRHLPATSTGGGVRVGGGGAVGGAAACSGPPIWLVLVQAVSASKSRVRHVAARLGAKSHGAKSHGAKSFGAAAAPRMQNPTRFIPPKDTARTQKTQKQAENRSPQSAARI